MLRIRLALSLLAIAVASTAPRPVAAAPPSSGPEMFAGIDVDAPIALRGLVVDRARRPIAGATIEIIDFGAGGKKADSLRIATGRDGRFAVAGLARRSVLLRIAHPDQSYYPEVIPIDLQRAARTRAVNAGALTLTTRIKGRARLMFVGDTMLGRRLIDGDQDGVEGEAGDLIRPDSRAVDAKRILRFTRDVLSSADYTLANLECVVTDDPRTPHPYKAYLLHAHPEALAGLVDAGIDGVSTGNNHVFDYLGPGVSDTLDLLAAAGLDASGADMNETMARETTIQLALNGVDLALQGMSVMRIDGSDASKYQLVARDPAKPGALHASTENINYFLAAEADAGFAVPMLHGGEEYTRYPSDAMRRLFVDAIEGGAGLVVAHHPHVLHGIGVVDGDDARRFVLMSLGNFLFDQDTSDTSESMIAIVDVDVTPTGGHEVHRVELIPVVLDHYVPKLLAGEGLVRLGRRLGHLSTTLPTHPDDSPAPDGLRGAVVFVAGHRVVALKNPAQFTIAEASESARVPVRGRATAAIAYPRHGAADSLARVHTSAPATLQLGRDVLLHGDFEDHDVDGKVGEVLGWERSASAFVQGAVVRRGARAAVLRRAAVDHDTTALLTDRRAPIVGGSRLTIGGHLRGDGAGALTVRVRFFHDAELLGEKAVHTEPAGTYDWTAFSTTITAPAGASGMHLSFRQAAPPRGTGTLFIDDIAVIQWERSLPLLKGDDLAAEIATPNDWGYLRFVDVAHNHTTLDATLTHRTYALK